MARIASRSLTALALAVSSLAASCSDDEPKGGAGASGIGSIPATTTLTSPLLSAPVDVVRDTQGIPHIYGDTVPDVSYAQGYIMASDRMLQMDFARHRADGTLARLFGALSPAVVDGDITMRVHHLRATARAGLAKMRASSDPTDALVVATVESFSSGVNAYISELRAGKHTLPSDVAFAYGPTSVEAWLPEDSLLLGELQAFSLAFDADSDIRRSQIEAASALSFDAGHDAAHKARAGAAPDFFLFAPIDKTHTIDGWTGMNGDTSTASYSQPSGAALALFAADRPSVDSVGLDRMHMPSKGSNNWVVGPALSRTGNVLVANDTHLGLSNPSTFYLNHLVARKAHPAFEVMGVQFPGIPAIVLGMNRHVAWGSTVSNIDVTDVYHEAIVTCDDGASPCVLFKGAKVALAPRQESFDIGVSGVVSSTLEVTLYDVPHHGPVIPRVDPATHAVEALGSNELSVRYTGYESAPILKAVFALNVATTMQEGVKALDEGFRYGGQNWVLGDDQGHFGWTQTVRVPRRSAGSPPWKVLPGDGSAEWGGDMDARYIPHAYDPARGYLATANADPIGETDDNDPFNGPVADGSPLYLGSDYDPGARIGRITKRLEAQRASKMTLDDMQSIQSDAITELGPLFAPTFLDAAAALAEEAASPGTHPELGSMVTSAKAPTRALFAGAHDVVAAWSSFDTPSGVAEAGHDPSASEIADARATLLVSVWTSYFADAAIGDEIEALRKNVPKLAKTDALMGTGSEYALLDRMCNSPTSLVTGIDPTTNDARLFDDLATPAIETKRQIAARALIAALDFVRTKLGDDATTWRWGQLHTLTLGFFVSAVPSLNVPAPDDATFAGGFPRHGGDGTVDVGPYGLSLTDFSYAHGPAIRFVCEVTPAGPRARNVLPGGEIFDSQSPHYRDQIELWRKNQTFDLSFSESDVTASAQHEFAANKLGRVRFTPAAR